MCECAAERGDAGGIGPPGENGTSGTDGLDGRDGMKGLKGEEGGKGKRGRNGVAPATLSILKQLINWKQCVHTGRISATDNHLRKESLLVRNASASIDNTMLT